MAKVPYYDTATVTGWIGCVISVDYCEDRMKGKVDAGGELLLSREITGATVTATNVNEVCYTLPSFS